MGGVFRDVKRAKGFAIPRGWPNVPPADRVCPEWGTLVFTCSISDFFIEEADEWRDAAWEQIRRRPDLTFQILTKRPERIAGHLPRTCFTCGSSGTHFEPFWGSCREPLWWPWPNVWIGTSVETERRAEERIPKLAAVPAAMRFLSCEPLLGNIDFGHYTMRPRIGPRESRDEYPLLERIGWVIAGGESGPGHRPMDLSWARGIRAACAEAGVPFFYKQGSGALPGSDPALDGREWREFPRQQVQARPAPESFAAQNGGSGR